jgi:hypothetical protein
VAAYFAALVSALEAPAGLARYVGPGGTAIQGAIFCCYDAFARVDVRCELSLPGGVRCYALDGVGEAMPCAGGAHEEAQWRRVRVSSALRALRAPPLALQARLGCLHCGDAAPPRSPGAEAALVADALALRREPGAAAAWAALAGRGPGVLPEAARHFARAPPEDVVLETLLRHCLRARRAGQAAAALAQALAEESQPGWDAAQGAPSAAAPLAAALLAQRDWAAAAAVLAAAVARAPRDARLLLLQSECAAGAGDAAAALAHAAAAAGAAPAQRAVWLRLAAAHAACGAPEAALVALNCAPHVAVAEEAAADAWRGAFPGGAPPRAARATAPPAPAGAAAADARAWEEAALPGRAALARLRAAQLLPPPHALPYAAGAHPRRTPLAPAAAAAAGVYSVLVDLVAELGWEGFLAARAAVFVMDTDDGRAEDSEEGSEAEEAEEEEEEEGSDSGREAAAAAPAQPQRESPARAGTRQAGVRAAGAPPPGSSPQHAPRAPPQQHAAAAAAPAAAEAADALAASAPAAEAEAAGASRARSRGEADVARDRLALAARAPLAPQRLCAEWLDVLIGALYDDVAEYAAWRTAEAADARAAQRAAAAAGAAAGEPGAADAEEEEEEEDAEEALALDAVDTDAALGTAGDWARRGALCERLKRSDDAERAYRVCVHLGFHAAAWRALARLYAAWGWAPEALTAVAQLAAAAHSADDAEAEVSQPLRALIAAVGLQAARQAQEALGAPPPVVNAAFHEAVRWKSDGWDA